MSALASADSPPVAPEPKALIEKSIESAGGREKLNAIKSMSIRGEISMPAQNINGTMEVYMKSGKAAVIADLPGIGQIRSGINGDIAYEVSDIMGARLLSDDEKKQLLDGMNPDDQFDRYLNLEDMKVTGPEKVGEADTWKLTGKNKSGEEESHWIDTHSYRTLKSKMVMNHQMGKIPVEMSFSDYKVIDGIPFPATITNTVGPATMVMKMKEVKLNAEIDDAKFVVPEEAKKLAEPQKPPSTRSTKDSGKPTAATLLDKYLEADGGFDAISKHPITRTVAEVTPPENRPKFKQVMQRSGVNTRTVEDRGLTKVVSGIFDGHGYSYIEYQGNPQSSKLLPRELSENQLKSLAEPALLRSPFADESKLSVEGPEKVQGRATWKLSGQDRLGGELVWWIDAEQFVPLKQIHTPSATDGAGMPMESVYEDYRKVGPRIFSHRQTFVRSDRPGGTDRFSTVYQYTTVEVNGKVEPADLLPPRPIQKLIEEAKATTRPAEGK